MAKMFQATGKPPVKYGLIRYSGGTTIYMVLGPIFEDGDQWVVGCAPIGRMDKGVFKRTKKKMTRRNYQEVSLSTRWAYHTVEPGPACPLEWIAKPYPEDTSYGVWKIKGQEEWIK